MSERADATTEAARSIIESEKRKRDAKTERLRNARLAKEAAEPLPVKKKAVRKKAKR